MLEKAKVAILLQGNWRYLPREFFEGFLEMAMHTMSKFKESEIGILYVKEACIDVGRNLAVKQALAWGADYLLLVDLDQRLRDDTLEKFARAMSEREELDLVSALIAHRAWPHHPNFVNVGEAEDLYLPEIAGRHGLLEVDLVGMGCVLIRRRVFEVVSPPWFAFIRGKDGVSIEMSEDIYFMFKCNEAGLRIAVDLDNPVGHLDSVSFTVARNWDHRQTGNPRLPVLNRVKEQSRMDWKRHREAYEQGIFLKGGW